MAGPRVTVYTITGRQGPFHVPQRLCEECDLTVQVVKRAVEEVGGGRVDMEVRPWLRHFLRALSLGGWHPPVVVIDGRVAHQGSVPDAAAIRGALEARLRAH